MIKKIIFIIIVTVSFIGKLLSQESTDSICDYAMIFKSPGDSFNTGISKWSKVPLHFQVEKIYDSLYCEKFVKNCNGDARISYRLIKTNECIDLYFEGDGEIYTDTITTLNLLTLEETKEVEKRLKPKFVKSSGLYECEEGLDKNGIEE